MYPELEAVTAQCDDFGALVDSLSADDWDRPTRCGDWTIRALWTHVCWGLPFMLEVFDAPPPEAPNTDRYRRWVEETDGDVSPELVDRYRHWFALAESLPDGERASFFHRYVPRYLDHMRDPDRLVDVFGQRIRLDDSASVDAIELGVHTMDLQQALGRPETLHPLAVPILVDVFDTILGAKPHIEAGWDPVTYVLTATGRRSITASERSALGDLATRFPVIV